MGEKRHISRKTLINQKSNEIRILPFDKYYSNNLFRFEWLESKTEGVSLIRNWIFT